MDSLGVDISLVYEVLALPEGVICTLNILAAGLSFTLCVQGCPQMESPNLLTWTLDHTFQTSNANSPYYISDRPKLKASPKESRKLDNQLVNRPKFSDNIDGIIYQLSYDSKGHRRTVPPIDPHSVCMAERAISRLSISDPRYIEAFRILVTIRAARFESTEDHEDLNKAISAAEACITEENASWGASPIPQDIKFMPSMEELAADLYAWRFHLTGATEDMTRAISHMRSAKSSMSYRQHFPQDDAYALILYNLGVLLYEKFCSTSDPQDLNEAIAETTLAIECAQAFSSDRATFLASLGMMLHDRFDTTGDLADLDLAITRTEEAIAVLEHGSTSGEDDELNAYLMEATDMRRKREEAQEIQGICQRMEEQSLAPLSTLSSLHTMRPASTIPGPNGAEACGTASVAEAERTASLQMVQIQPKAPHPRKSPDIASETIGAVTTNSPEGSPSFYVDQAYFFLSYRLARDCRFTVLIASNMASSCRVYSYSLINKCVTATEDHISSWMDLSAPYSLTPCSKENEEEEEPALGESTPSDSDTDSSEPHSDSERAFLNEIFDYVPGRVALATIGMRHSGYRQRPTNQNGSPSASQSRNCVSSGGLSSSLSTSSTTGKRSHRQSDVPGNGGEESDDEEEVPKKRTKAACTQAERKAARRLKCPYYQRRPEDHPDAACRGGGFMGMGKLKDHLKRKHLMPVKCVRCWQEMTSPEVLQQHLQRSLICSIADEPADDRISASKLQKLNFNSGRFARARNVEQKWGILYQELFPNEQTTPSPYELPGLSTSTERRFLDIFEEEALKELDPAVEHFRSKLSEVIRRTRNRLQREFELSNSLHGLETPFSDDQKESDVSFEESSSPDTDQVGLDGRETAIIGLDFVNLDLQLPPSLPSFGDITAISSSPQASPYSPLPTKPANPFLGFPFPGDMRRTLENIGTMSEWTLDVDSFSELGADNSIWFMQSS